MKMLEFTEKIFQELGFETVLVPFELEQVDHSFKVFFREKSAYAVIEIKDNMTVAFGDFLGSYQSKLFEAALSNEKFKDDLKKNSYLLVLTETKVAKDYTKKFFINIEEDPFFFKKYVFRYSEDDLKALIEKTSSTNIITGLGQLAIDHNVFNKFSEGSKNRAGYESLIYQIYVKIPATSLPTASKDIGDLPKEIQSKLTEGNLKEQNEKLLKALNSVDEKNIDLKLFKEIAGQL